MCLCVCVCGLFEIPCMSACACVCLSEMVCASVWNESVCLSSIPAQSLPCCGHRFSCLCTICPAAFCWVTTDQPHPDEPRAEPSSRRVCSLGPHLHPFHRHGGPIPGFVLTMCTLSAQTPSGPHTHPTLTVSVAQPCPISHHHRVCWVLGVHVHVCRPRLSSAQPGPCRVPHPRQGTGRPLNPD